MDREEVHFCKRACGRQGADLVRRDAGFNGRLANSDDAAQEASSVIDVTSITHTSGPAHEHPHTQATMHTQLHLNDTLVGFCAGPTLIRIDCCVYLPQFELAP